MENTCSHTELYIYMFFERPGSPWLSEILSVLALFSEEPKVAALGGTVLSRSAQKSPGRGGKE